MDVALLFVGPKRLPEMGSAIGKTMREFQRSMHEIAHEEPRAGTGEAVEPAAPAGMLAPADARARMEDAREDAAAPSATGQAVEG